ncbi:MAG: flavin reductase family protein [Gemmataceae bacterium]|nr:flavin reductase family protein [Gemmataceae bacterium]
MIIDTSSATLIDIYTALVGVVTPRPIAWVTTVDGAGRINLAPFSFFNAVGSKPPTVMFCPARKPDGGEKDTLANLAEVAEFVVNSATAELAEAVNQSSIDLPRGQSEAEHLGLELIPSLRVQPPRVAASPAHLECRVRQIIRLDDGPSGANLVLGDILTIHVSDEVLDERGRVDPKKYQTLARLGGEWYCRATDLFTMKRPG